MTHVGMMKDIMATGHVSSRNFYPAIHLLGVSLLDVTGLSYAAVTSLLSIFFYCIYLLNVCVLAIAAAARRGQALLVVAFASPLVFSLMHTLIHPSVLSVFLLPLLLYFEHRRQQLPSGQGTSPVALAVLTLLIFLMHPVTGIFTVALFIVLRLSPVLYKCLTCTKVLSSQNGGVKVSDYIVPITGFVVFLLWLLPHPDIAWRLAAVRDFLSGADGTSVLARQLGILSGAGITAGQTIELFIARYGAIFICGIIAGLASLIAVIPSFGRTPRPERMHFSYALLFIGGIAASVFSLFGYTGEHDPIRISRFFLVLAPIVSGLVLYDLINKQRAFTSGRRMMGRTGLIGTMMTLIVVASVLSALNVYGSARIVERNWQVTAMEIEGTKWFSSHRDTNSGIAVTAIPLGRYDDFNFGMESSPVRRAPTYPAQIASHFGYDVSSSIAKLFDFRDTYLLTCEVGRTLPLVVPENVRDRAHHYTEWDFARLRTDPNVSQIYANGEFEVWRVYGETT